jgi:hypothetical protein
VSFEAVEGVIPSALAAVVEVGAIGAFLWMGIGGMFGLAFCRFARGGR